MKKVLLLVIGLVFSTNALATAATTGTLVLSGTVAPVSSIVVTPNGTNNTNLDLLNGASAVNVASVAETSNDSLGYKINAKSANGGSLKNGSFSVPFTITYNGGSAVSLTTSDQQVKGISSLAKLTTNSSAVTVTTTANANLVAGTYSDTVTFTIVAN